MNKWSSLYQSVLIN